MALGNCNFFVYQLSAKHHVFFLGFAGTKLSHEQFVCYGTRKFFTFLSINPLLNIESTKCMLYHRHLLSCRVRGKLVRVYGLIQMMVGFLDVIFFTKHDHCKIFSACCSIISIIILYEVKTTVYLKSCQTLLMWLFCTLHVRLFQP